MMMLFAGLLRAADLDIGPLDRYRVPVADVPGAEAGSATASVLLEPPAEGPYTLEELPVLDTYVAQEGIDALAAGAWHAEGLTGAGVKVAVFDYQWYGAELIPEELGEFQTHDCQSHRSCLLPIDTLRSRYSFEEGSHGVACSEVIRDIAPGVELHLVRVNGSVTLENAARWAGEEGIDIASMSLSFFNNSFNDGTGLINDLAAQLAENGVLLVASAGNYAKEHRMEQFSDPDGDGDMDFPWGSSYLPMYFSEGPISVTVSWEQFRSCGRTDLDLYLYRQDGMLIGKAEALQDGSAQFCAPVERLSAVAEEGDWYYLQIVRRSGDPVVRIASYAREGSVYQPTPGGLADPASSLSAFTVGAVRAVDYLANGPESFSSTGPTHDGLAKPDIAGPDGLSSYTYGPVGFYGTSASTPATAAALALWMEAHPGSTAREAADAMQAAALSDRSVWQAQSGEFGAGKARLPDPTPMRGVCGGGGGALLLLPAGFLSGRRPRRTRPV